MVFCLVFVFWVSFVSRSSLYSCYRLFSRMSELFFQVFTMEGVTEFKRCTTIALFWSVKEEGGAEVSTKPE